MREKLVAMPIKYIFNSAVLLFSSDAHLLSPPMGVGAISIYHPSLHFTPLYFLIRTLIKNQWIIIVFFLLLARLLVWSVSTSHKKNMYIAKQPRLRLIMFGYINYSVKIIIKLLSAHSFHFSWRAHFCKVKYFFAAAAVQLGNY